MAISVEQFRYGWLISPSREPEPASVQIVLNLVSKDFSIPISELKGKGKQKPTVHARNVAMFFMRGIGLQLKEIGFELGRRDHSTVVHGLLTVEELIKNDPEFKDRLDNLQDQLAFQRIEVNPLFPAKRNNGLVKP